jgi:DNA modification methylase
VVNKGFSDCGCNAGRAPGVCLDIFGGSGTLAVPARNLRRKAILIDVSEKYRRLQVKKITTGK